MKSLFINFALTKLLSRMYESKCPSCMYTVSLLKLILYFFRWLRNHQLNVGLLLDSEFIITRRKYFCQQYIKYLEEGYNMYCLDETFVNGRYLLFTKVSFISLFFYFPANYVPSRLLHDTTVKSSAQVRLLHYV